MPDVERSAERGAGVAGGGLHEDILPAAAAFQELDQQRVVEQAAGQAQILAFAGHGQHGFFDGALQSARDGGGERRRESGAVFQSQALEEFRAEAAAGGAMAVEERGVEASAGGDDFAEQCVEAVVAGGREPLDLMFVGARAEAQQLGHGAVQPGQRIRILPLLFELQLIALRLPARAAAEVAGVIEREHRRFFEGRREERGRGVGQVMLHHGDFGLRE